MRRCCDVSCLFPRCVIYSFDPITGECSEPRYSGMTYYSLRPEDRQSDSQFVIPVPCGQCDGCKLDSARVWADRMILELDHSKKAIFLTLTYDDEHLPVRLFDTVAISGELPSLDKRDCQLFFKSLRDKVNYRDYQIRYYLVGEYGAQTHRPHYHAIVFGIGLDDIPDLVPLGQNEFHQPYFISEKFSKEIWKHGNVLISNVSWNTCAYCARYLKKSDPTGYYETVRLSTPDPVEGHGDIIAPFALMSRRPGIGGYFWEDHPDFEPDVRFSASDPHGFSSSRNIKLPAYVINKLAEFNPALFEQFDFQRRLDFFDALDSELQNTDQSAMMYSVSKASALRHKLDLSRKRTL